MATDTLHGIKAIINIANLIEVEAFRIAEKTYVYGYSWVEKFGIDKKKLSQKTSKYHLTKLSKAYDERTESNLKVKVDGISEPYVILSKVEVAEICKSLVQLGHIEVLDLIIALAIEALEQRAATAFNETFTDVEKDTSLSDTWQNARQQVKKTRRNMTDAIKAWCERNDRPEKVQGYCVYCSDTLNLHLFGKKSSQLKIERIVPKDKLLRDFYTSDELYQVDRIEDRVILLADMMNIKPTDAIKTVIDADKGFVNL